jgi:excisionase family DNA binding protein
MTVTQTLWTSTGVAPLRVTARPPVARASAPSPAGREVLMTVPEVAAACKLSETTVRRAISAGELHALKLRNCLRIERAALDAWIAAQRHSPVRAAVPSRPASRARRPARTGSFRALVHADAARAQAR